MDDAQIINLFWNKNELAITEVNTKYGAYCFSIANNILHNQEDSEECVNDTWLHTWNAIPPTQPNKLQIFLAKITRNLSFNRYNAKHAKKRGCGEIFLVLDELSSCIAHESDLENIHEAKELGRCINLFVHALPKREGNIFIRRYFFTDPITAIAERYALTENHLMVILNRTRKKLRNHLIKEGYIYE